MVVYIKMGNADVTTGAAFFFFGFSLILCAVFTTGRVWVL